MKNDKRKMKNDCHCERAIASEAIPNIFPHTILYRFTQKKTTIERYHFGKFYYSLIGLPRFQKTKTRGTSRPVSDFSR